MSQPILIALTVLALVAFWWLKRPTITASEAHDAVAKGARIIDVRSAGEFASGHIAGAKNIPVDQLGARIGELGSKDAPIILYCASGARSAMATRTLVGKGFKSVRNLGAMRNW